MVAMSTLISNIGDELSRSDLDTQIQREIVNAHRFYANKMTFITERRGGTLTTVADQTWYGTIDFSASDGEGTLGASVDVQNVVRVEYIKIQRAAGVDEPIWRVSYRKFEEFVAGSPSTSVPTYWTFAGGKIGLWPTPDAAYTVYVSAFVKPVEPSVTTDESPLFDYAQELIEASAAQRVCAKYLLDTERAAVYAGIEARLWRDVQSETTKKVSTSRITPTSF